MPPKNIISIKQTIIWVKNESNSSYTFGIHPDVQAALVSLEPETGQILAMVGGYNFNAKIIEEWDQGWERYEDTYPSQVLNFFTTEDRIKLANCS